MSYEDQSNETWKEFLIYTLATMGAMLGLMMMLLYVGLMFVLVTLGFEALGSLYVYLGGTYDISNW